MQTRFITLITSLLALAGAQHYQLQSYYPGATFLDNFDFYTSWDPTYGYVHYVDRSTAELHGMISYTANTTRWGVDSTQVLDPTANLGRLSLRLMSKQSWTHGLFVLDLKHMPANTCGAWPAFWTVGSGTWPATGEIDIVEFTNTGPSNLMAMHTLPGCSIAGDKMTGQLDYNNCNQGDGYTGCAIRSKAAHSSGTRFNTIGGGVYAFEWTSRYVRVWWFPRGSAPDSIAGDDTTTVPDTNTFGVPIANFEGSCNLDDFLYNHTAIFNVDFCGTYAGNVFGLQGCPMTEPDNAWSSCVNYVALTPGAFTETYWEVNFMKVYQDNTGWTPASSALSSVTPAASSSSVSKLSSNAQGRPTTPTMSLAGTTPTDISGSFSATSSVLSAISSFSTASEASFSSSLSAVGSPAVSTSASGLPFSSSTTQASIPSPQSPPPPSSTPSPETMPPLSTSPAIPGVTFVTVVVPEVVTVYVPPPAGEAIHQHGRHRANTPLEVWTTSTSVGIIPSTWPTATSYHRANCSFSIPRTAKSTGFVCTFTKLGPETEGPLSAVYTSTTDVSSGAGLTFSDDLTIDTISVQTQTLRGAALGATFTAIAGSFTQSATSVIFAVLTASPVAAQEGASTSFASSAGSTAVSSTL